MKLSLLFLLLSGVFLAACDQNLPQQSKGPNIIFILADDMGWADLPAYGNKFNEAPNLDQLVRDGKRFTNAYAACPVCSPTRASIMTGQYPARVGIIDFITGHWRPYEKVTVPINRTQYLPGNLKTIGNIMKEAGYATGYFGKWHLGSKPENHPTNFGFDVAEEYVGGGFYHSKFKPALKVKPKEQRLSEILTDMGIDFINKNKNNPFFLFLAHYDVHVQLDADTVLIEKYLNKKRVPDYPCNAVYAAMIEHVDRSVGRIVNTVDSLGLSNNTVILFFSDNGGLKMRFDKIVLLEKSKRYVYEGDSLAYIASSNYPLRREKGTIYEGGIREPMIIKWPGKVEGGSISDALISSVDFYPALASLAGVDMPAGQVVDGTSFIDEILEGKDQNKERAIFWHYPVYHHDVPASAVRQGDWKLIHNLVDNTVELYNLKNDIGESQELSKVYPDKARELSALLDQWREDVGARLPVPNPDFDESKRHQWARHPSALRK